MNFLKDLVTNIKDMNTATLTGAVDVILVQQRDGTFKSTPFHVRFGKIGVAWSDNKMVYVEVNGKEVDLTMRLDQWGTAYFPDTRGTVGILMRNNLGYSLLRKFQKIRVTKKYLVEIGEDPDTTVIQT